MLDLDKVTEQSLASFAESLAKEQVDRYENAKKSIRSFRESLHDFAESITDDKNKKPLVFIIDELDRCRPSFSIEVLEKAKHFFNVNNIIFVLGADKEQLGSAIKAVYGEGLNVNGYLRRFIDFDYVLPPPDKGKFVKALFQKCGFYEYFSQKTNLESQFEYEHAINTFEELFSIYKLTLREQVHCCSLLSLAIKTTSKNSKLFPIFLCFLIVLKVKKPDLYNSFFSVDLMPDSLLNQIEKLPGGRDFLKNSYGTVLEAYIVTCKDEPHEHKEVEERYKTLINLSSASDSEKRRAHQILKYIDDFNFNAGVGVLNYLTKKIDIASRFKS